MKKLLFRKIFWKGLAVARKSGFDGWGFQVVYNQAEPALLTRGCGFRTCFRSLNRRVS